MAIQKVLIVIKLFNQLNCIFQLIISKQIQKEITLTQSSISGFRLSKSEQVNDSNYDITFFKNHDAYNFILGLRSGTLMYYNTLLFKDEFKGCTSEIIGAFYMDKDDVVLGACESRVLIWNKKKMEGIWNWNYQIQNTIDIGVPIDEFYSLEPVKERLIIVRSKRDIFIYQFLDVKKVNFMNKKVISQDVLSSKSFGNKIMTLESDNQLRIYHYDESSIPITTFGNPEHKNKITDFIQIRSQNVYNKIQDTQEVASVDISGKLIKWSAEKVDLISCSEGYYLDNSKICQKCSYTCKTCNEVNKCLTCKINMNRVEQPVNNGQCNCLDKYFDFSVNERCEKCHFTCLSCQVANNDSLCLSCDTSDTENGNRVLTKIQSNQTQNKCVCKQGYYEDPQDFKCKKCHHSCQNCSSYSVCTQCDSGQNIKRLALSSDNKCNCLEGYYDDGKQMACQKCHFSCQKCEGGNTQNFCTSCPEQKISNRIYVSNQLQCSCINGYFDYQQDVNCQQCSNTCLTCVENSNKCTSCSQQLYRVLNKVTNQCDCKTGYYPDPKSNSCIKCPYNCKTCDSPDQCLSCEDFDLSYRKNIKQSNICQCIDGYFDNGKDTKCIKCSYNCKTCSDISTCTSCQSDNIKNRKPFEESQTCSCLDGFYDSGIFSICKKCDYNCLTCSKSGQCTQCQSDTITNRLSLNAKNQCNCKEGYYDDKSGQMNCKKCPNNCKTCNEKGECTSCEVNQLTNRINSIINGKCQCMDGYYDDNASVACQKCHPNCKTCKGPNFDECLSCSFEQGRQFQNSPTTCDCLPNYKEIGQPQCEIVYQCHHSCRSCFGTSQDQCINCFEQNQSFREQVNNSCKCMKGHYEENQQPTCKKCHATCSECSGPSNENCTSCEINENRIMDTVTSKCICKPGYYFDELTQKCFQCNTTCKTCSGPSNNQCISCFEEQGRGIEGNTCSCQKELSFYEVMQDNCFKKLPCISPCKECSLFDPNQCESCIDENAHFSNNKCECNDGFFEILDQNKKYRKCEKCSDNCKTCKEQNDKCTSCHKNLLLNQHEVCKDEFPTKFSNETIRLVYNVTETSAYVSVGATATASIVLSIASPNGNLVQQFLTLQKLHFLLLLDVAFPEILYIFFKAVSGATPVETLQKFNLLYQYFIPDHLKQSDQHYVTFDRKKLDTEKINGNILYNAGGTVFFYAIVWALLIPVVFLYNENKLIKSKLEVYSSFANYLKKIYEKIVSLIFLQVHEILSLVLHFSVYVAYVSFILCGSDISNINVFAISSLAFHIYALSFIIFLAYIINNNPDGIKKQNSTLLMTISPTKNYLKIKKPWLQIMRQHVVSDFITSDKMSANFKFVFFLVETTLIPASVILLFRHSSAQISLCLVLQIVLFIYAIKKRPHQSILNNILLILDQFCWVMIFSFIGIISLIINRILKESVIEESDITLIDSLSQVVVACCLTIMFANPIVTIIKLIGQFPAVIKNIKNVYKKYKLSKKQKVQFEENNLTKETYYSKYLFQNKKTQMYSQNNIQLSSSQFQSHSPDLIAYKKDSSYLERINSVSALGQFKDRISSQKLVQNKNKNFRKSQTALSKFGALPQNQFKKNQNLSSQQTLSQGSNDSDETN